MVQFLIESFIDIMLSEQGWGVISKLDFGKEKALPHLVPAGLEPPDIEQNQNKKSLYCGKFRSTPTLSQIIQPGNDRYGLSLFPVNDPNCPGNNLSGRQIDQCPILIPTEPQHFGFFDSIPRREREALYAALSTSNISYDGPNDSHYEDIYTKPMELTHELVDQLLKREPPSPHGFPQWVQSDDDKDYFITRKIRPHFPIFGSSRYQSHYLSSLRSKAPVSASPSDFHYVSPKHSAAIQPCSLLPSHYNLDPNQIKRVLKDDFFSIMQGNCQPKPQVISFEPVQQRNLFRPQSTPPPLTHTIGDEMPTSSTQLSQFVEPQAPPMNAAGLVYIAENLKP
jgi:hypothetical protein